MTDRVLRLVFLPCLPTAPLSGAFSYGLVLRQRRVSVSGMPRYPYIHALPLQASVDLLPAMDVSTLVAPRVRPFVPFVGNKDVGQKDGAPRPTPSQEFPLMSGERTTDSVPCASAVVRTPLDAAWDLKGTIMCYKKALINLCDSEGYLKRCDVKMPIAINSPTWDGTVTLGAVVRCATQPRGGGETQIKERSLMHAPLKYTWNHNRWTSLSKFKTIGGQPVADHVRTWLENEIRAGEREAVQVKSEKSEAQDTPNLDSNVYPLKKRKTTTGLFEELVLSPRSYARAEQSPRPANGASSTDIKALRRHTPRRGVGSRRSTKMP